MSYTISGNETVKIGDGVTSTITTQQIANLASGAGPNAVTNPSSAVSGNLPSFSSSSGKVIGDSGVAVSSLVSTGIANTFTQAQTFSGGLSGTLTGAASLNLLLGGGNLTGTVNNTGVFNTTNVAGYQQFGSTVLNAVNVVNGSLTLGLGAGADLPGGSIYTTCIGYGAGASFTGATGEGTFIGTIAGNKLTTGNFCTAVGEHALGYETTGGLNTMVGNDCGRNGIGMQSNSGYGRAAMYMYFGSNSTAIGVDALEGNAAAIYLNGAITGGGGDTVTVTFTSAAISGGSTTAAYTSVPGDTLATFATNLTAAMEANGTFTGATGGMGAQTIGNPSNFILISYPGNSQLGTAGALTVTAVSSGSAGVTTTISGGVQSSATSNIAIGISAMAAFAMTTASHNVSIGGNSLQAVSTGSYNIAIGDGCLSLVTTSIQNVFIGGVNGLALVGAGNNVGVGYSALNSIVNVTGSTAVGAFAGQHSTVTGAFFGYQCGQNLTSGIGNTAVGTGALTGVASATAAFNVAIGNFTLEGVSSAPGNVGIGYAVGTAVSTGDHNILLGYETAHLNLTTGGSNIWISSGGTAYDPGNLSNTLWIGQGSGTHEVISATSLNTTPVVSIPGSLTIGGVMTLQAQPVFASSTTGAGAQTFTNSPAASLTVGKFIPVTITGTAGTCWLIAVQ